MEFHVLWSDRTGGRLPFPLRFTARTRDADRWEADVIRTRSELRERLGTSFDQVLAALIAPDIRISVHGSDHRKPEEPESLIRMMGARRGTRGYIVQTVPGENFWYSKGFTVRQCDAVRLADEMTALMPEGEMGKQAEIVLPAVGGPAGQDRPSGGPNVRDTFTLTPQQRGAAFLAAPASCVGAVQIEQGTSIYGPRGITRFRLDWRDVVDDGRYVIRDNEPPVAVPADAKVLTTLINAKVAQVVRAIKEERQRG